MNFEFPEKHREQWKLIFPNCPEWVLNYIIGPFADEVGWPIVALRWIFDGLVIGGLAIAFIPMDVLGGAIFWLFVTVGVIALMTEYGLRS